MYDGYLVKRIRLEEEIGMSNHKLEWSEYPVIFQRICKSVFLKDGYYSYSDAFSYLSNVSMSSRKEVIQYILMNNRFFADCMYPLELHEKYWTANLDIIFIILKKAEVALNIVKKEICTGIPAMTSYDKYDLVAASQYINFYFFTHHVYAGWKKMQYFRMNKITTDTINNTEKLLTRIVSDNLLNNIEFTSCDEIYMAGMEYWQEPLAWAYHEFRYSDAAKILYRYYRHYYQQLSGKCECIGEIPCLRELVLATKKRLICIKDELYKKL